MKKYKYYYMELQFKGDVVTKTVAGCVAENRQDAIKILQEKSSVKLDEDGNGCTGENIKIVIKEGMMTKELENMIYEE